MLVVFQRRLLYMPYFPPGSRTQELDPADPMLRGLTVRKLSFAPVDGSPRLDGLLLTPSSLGSRPPEGLIYYLQGNAGNTLARLPKFRELLFPAAATDPPTLGLFALSPRGYWSSGGPLPFPLTALTPPGHRLSQRGLLRDYGRVLAELGQRSELKNVPVWLHGHSLAERWRHNSWQRCARQKAAQIISLDSSSKTRCLPSHTWSKCCIHPSGFHTTISADLLATGGTLLKLSTRSTTVYPSSSYRVNTTNSFPRSSLEISTMMLAQAVSLIRPTTRLISLSPNTLSFPMHYMTPRSLKPVIDSQSIASSLGRCPTRNESSDC
ncbi:hypothetical protein KEM48_002030 [Puccinia striiformis f. sp. tritici PST-130]|nr:hypothetical protein KEM48_002030 [Puccinia striiformis f. sp. tritici PST-130]